MDHGTHSGRGATQSYKIGAATLEILQGDIAEQAVDAIVNAANEGLCGGAGVDGAIHRVGGPTIMAECREIGRCATGQAVVTRAGSLPARWVIHTVGPKWRGGDHGEPDLLASAYRESLARATKLGASSIAFPSLSTGAYGYPLELAAPIAIGTLQANDAPELVRMVLFTPAAHACYVAAANRLIEPG